MTKRKIVLCVECPEYGRIISTDYCKECDYFIPFNVDESTIDCSYGE